jgi:deoxycytidylate deaminase
MILRKGVVDLVKHVASTSLSRRKVGCILLRKGRVVVTATNMEGKTHPLQTRLANLVGQPYRISLHAELRALIKNKNSSCDTLIVARVHKNGGFLLSKPCPVCQLAIREAGIKNVYYSTDSGDLELLEFPA